MSDVIRMEDRYYILANSSLAEETTRVLKHAETFLVTDRQGNIRPLGIEDHGLFFEGTRFLSRYLLTIDGKSPVLLSSSVAEDNTLLTVDLTNPDLSGPNGQMIRKGSIHLHRSAFLFEGRYFECIRLSSFSGRRLQVELRLEFASDYADIFEVRGLDRERRGETLETEVAGDAATLRYRGLDGVTRSTRVDAAPAPSELDASGAGFLVELGPHEEWRVHLAVSCQASEPARLPDAYASSRAAVSDQYRRGRELSCRVESTNEQFNDWLNRSAADILMMLTDTPQGLYPYAGIPWYSTVFGRDGIITALQTLWFMPEIARGVLGFLAAHQAQDFAPEQEAEPGKILHELRKGEMAKLGEVPFGRYYGTIDATPLFVVLAGRYLRATGDLEFTRQLWPNLERALAWIDEYGDVDGDGFVEYARKTERGLSNQGWKDSDDSVFHADGTPAPQPIALCEVQGYVYEAKISASRIATLLGLDERSATLASQAATLRERFSRSFWSEELGTFALALDGNKRPCLVRSSNAGHCLFNGVASQEQAARVVSTLMSDRSFNGWGIRTIAAGEAAYNPMSYHNGSVWPHDNALATAGMARYGFREEAARVLAGTFDSSLFLDFRRLPELFCGFHRRPGEGPTLYPVACSPQAWAAGVPFQQLEGILGLTVDGMEGRVTLHRPRLPPFLAQLDLTNLRVGPGARVDLSLRRNDSDVSVQLVRREGDAQLAVLK